MINYYCDLCTRDITAEERREKNYIDVIVEIQRLKRRLHVCPNCADKFANMFIGRTQELLLEDMKDRLHLPKPEKKKKPRWALPT